MPIPKKKSSETNNEFINRCMSGQVMIKEYPNQNQRLAVCAAQLKTK